MVTLEFSLLGTPEIRHNGHALVFPTRKALALLVYLSVQGGLHSREKLTSLFWPESDGERARGVLRTTLSYLRNTLPKNDPPYLIIENDNIGFNFHSGFDSDLKHIQLAYQQVLQPDSKTLSLLEDAARIYKADFLEGFSLNDCLEFDQWCSLQRENWHRQMSVIFEKLFEEQMAAGKEQLAISTANRWVQHDLLHETAYYKLIELYVNLADRVSALRTYESYSKLLESELGIAPSPQLEALLGRLETVPTPVKSKPTLEESNRTIATPTIKPPSGKQILVAEDDPDLRLVLTTQLKNAGYVVSSVENGREAMQLLSLQKFDLLITDVMMPGMTGYELARTVRLTENSANMPILMLTSLSSHEDALLAFRDGVDAFVSKPYNYPQLKLKVAALLEGRPDTPLNLQSNKKVFSSGVQGLDEALGGSWPAGSNILLLGEFGSGKSTFIRHFLVEGLLQKEPALLISFNDNIQRLHHELNMLTGGLLAQYEQQGSFGLLDANEWLYPVNTVPDSLSALTQLTEAIIQVGNTLGQNTVRRRGGRRVLDTISSLFVHYDLSAVQRFLMQLARTAQAYGDVSTLFVLEQNSVNEHTLSNLKYFMDGVFEFRAGKIPEIRVADLKWQAHSKEWIPLNYY